MCHETEVLREEATKAGASRRVTMQEGKSQWAEYLENRDADEGAGMALRSAAAPGGDS